ncbi:DUF952 domain-containing protein [Sediminibacterium sp. TEGAF015]|uniref:DUF952 domain-containing protein n=1 Tax=Sediminibacterium sp. TEGAF015 TaxID=575378 RepID=UPI0021FE01B0|nr:DUF952 domain-containing protein [Sediminibacterium sp. TEGAF015]BDQ11765.1 hypothetical protein TEGAF0_09820 [Sediminibacterium sp. TEGAF015]
MKGEFIYHITTQTQWEEAKQKGFYEADTLASEGFMHCSTEDQVAGVLDRYYQGRTGLVKLTIQKDKVERPLIFELAGSINELFPHIHGQLNLDAVVAVTPI